MNELEKADNSARELKRAQRLKTSRKRVAFIYQRTALVSQEGEQGLLVQAARCEQLARRRDFVVALVASEEDIVDRRVV